MKKQDQNEKIKELLSNQDLPESLTSSQIRKKLESIPNKKKSLFPILVPIGALCVLALCAIPLLKDQLFLNQTNVTMQEDETDQQIDSTTAQLASVSDVTYDDVFRILSANYKKMDFEESCIVYDSNSISGSVDGGSANSDKFSQIAKTETTAGTENSSITSQENSKEDFSETNIQTQGVDEADRVKTDGKYLYVLNKNQLEIISVKGKELNKGTILSPTNENQILEFYLSGKNLILLETSYTDKYENQTEIRIFDITNPLKPKKISSQTQQGDYATSRLTDGYLYTFSSYQVLSKPVKNQPNTYIPSTNGTPIPSDCIILPEQTVNSTSYLLATALSISNPKNFSAKKAILTQSNEYYVSQKNIYISEIIYANTNSNIDRTNITKIPYEKGVFSAPITGTVAGTINNSFSMDEYKDYLRIVTTVQKYNNTTGSTQSNSLYILDKDLKKTGSITNLAPSERIYSARFMGETGYFVTFRQVDPLFSVDLSNPAKPKVLGQLKIPGFSDYLHFYDENLLLGIGRNANKKGEINGLKLSMFDISDPSNVKEIDKLILKDYDTASALSEHRDVLLHLSRNIFGFSAQAYGSESSKERMDYLLFTYTKKKGFKTLLKAPLDIKNGMFYSAKGVTIDDYLHIINPENAILTYGLKSYKKLNTFSLDN